MLSRHPLWIPATAHIPKFVDHFNRFLNDSPHNVVMQKALRYNGEDTRVLLTQDSKGGKSVLAMAFPFTVLPALCDMSRMGLGVFTSLVDTTTSLHVAAALLPSNDMHVSVSLQTNCVSPITAGEKVVLISRMDKFGKRLAFLSAQLLHEGAVSTDEVCNNLTAGEGLQEVERQLREYPVLANGRHVKCILPSK
uniref:Thioesterase domain-containing protein n=1 Tax=Trypanosoma congolense (strain IL3000) TaxID=1068625 RepID=G0UVL6_TRYCI|nr:conserved hypothetical protein [Trypanosoma congolense IL3000]